MESVLQRLLFVEVKSLMASIPIVLFAFLYLRAGAVEVRTALSSALGQDLPGTLVFDYPTISALAAYLTALPAVVPNEISEQRSEHPLTDIADPLSLPAPTHGHDAAEALQKVQGVLRMILGQDVHSGQPLAAAGVDSLAAIEIRDELSRSRILETAVSNCYILAFDYVYCKLNQAITAMLLSTA